jgi:TolA-binding protein
VIEFLNSIGFRVGDLFVLATIIGAFMKTDRENQKRETSREMRISQLGDELHELKDDVKEFRKALTDISNQKVQIDFLIKAYDDLRHGRGIVN